MCLCTCLVEYLCVVFVERQHSPGLKGGRRCSHADLMELSWLGQGRTARCTFTAFNENRMWSPRGVPGERPEEPPSATTVTNRIRRDCLQTNSPLHSLSTSWRNALLKWNNSLQLHAKYRNFFQWQSEKKWIGLVVQFHDRLPRQKKTDKFGAGLMLSFMTDWSTNKNKMAKNLSRNKIGVRLEQIYQIWERLEFPFCSEKKFSFRNWKCVRYKQTW